MEAAYFASAHGDSMPLHDSSLESDDDADSEYCRAISVACGPETTGLQSQLGATGNTPQHEQPTMGFPSVTQGRKSGKVSGREGKKNWAWGE